MEKQKNIPALRFPEFSGEWVEKKLGEVSSFLDGKRKPIKESDRSKMRGQYPYYGASGIIDYVNDFIFDEEIILLGEDGENIISRNLPLAFRVSGKCWVNNHAHVIKQNQSSDIDFLTYSLERISYAPFNTGTAQPKLNQEVCRGIVLILPSIFEQKKIANFLTAIDEKLQALKKKKALLEQYKKGVMQKIFSQELRFKDENGNDFADWEKRKIGDVFKVTRGNVLSMTLVKSQKDDINKYPVYSSQTRNNGVSGYFDKFLFENAITWTTDGANAGDVNYRNGKFYCTNVCGVLVSSEGYANLCISEILNTVSNKYVSYVGNPKLMNNVMAGISIAIPSTIDEQQKIANFLTAIDTKINHQQTEIEKVSHYKKGLLQQMFC